MESSTSISFQVTSHVQQAYRWKGLDTGWRRLPIVLLESSSTGRWILQTGQGEQVVEPHSLILIPAGLRHRLIAEDEMHSSWAFCQWVVGHRAFRFSNEVGVLPSVGPLFEKVLSEFECQITLLNQVRAHRLSLCLLEKILKVVQGDTGPKDSRLEAVVQYIEQKFALPLTRTELAEIAGLSETRFHEVFKASMGISPLQYVNQLRLQEAIQRLSAGDEPIAAIAEACGFSSPYYFSRFFHKKIGVSPRSFRETAQVKTG